MDKIEKRAAMKYLFIKVISRRDIYVDTLATLGDDTPSYSVGKNWVAEFNHGRSSAVDEHRSDHP